MSRGGCERGEPVPNVGMGRVRQKGDYLVAVGVQDATGTDVFSVGRHPSQDSRLACTRAVTQQVDP